MFGWVTGLGGVLAARTLEAGSRACSARSVQSVLSAGAASFSTAAWWSKKNENTVDVPCFADVCYGSCIVVIVKNENIIEL